ncbi:MAG: hypothetical protein JWN14_1564 [Chthonomonadales bacterium]|nr:hypothetical protein [Chthonomonadales bacterium]
MAYGRAPEGKSAQNYFRGTKGWWRRRLRSRRQCPSAPHQGSKRQTPLMGVVVCNGIVGPAPESRLLYHFLEVRYLPSNDVEATPPEVNALEVNAEAGGESDGIGETGRGEEVVVLGAEGGGVCVVASVEAEGEEEAAVVRVVVEGRSEIMTFDSLHIFRDGQGYRHIPRYASRAARKTSAGIVLLTACQSTKARSAKSTRSSASARVNVRERS